MGFHDVQFPPTLSYGYQGGPGFRTIVIETDSGHEERVTRWQSARWQFKASRELGTRPEISAIRDFFLARGGALNAFRFKDWADYTSGQTGTEVPTHLDQLIGTGDGTRTTFPLRKQYQSGSNIYVRVITLPVAGTVKVGKNGSEVGGWTVNTTTGIVTFTVAPAADDILTAGFEFDVPSRFGLEADEGLPTSIDAFDVQSLIQIPIQEVKDESPYHEGWDPGGSYINANMTADITLAINTGRLIVVQPQSASLNLWLPGETWIGSGGPYFRVINTSGTHALAVRDVDGTLVVSVGTNASKSFWLLDTGTALQWWAAN